MNSLFIEQNLADFWQGFLALDRRTGGEGGGGNYYCLSLSYANACNAHPSIPAREMSHVLSTRMAQD